MFEQRVKVGGMGGGGHVRWSLEGVQNLYLDRSTYCQHVLCGGMKHTK